MYFDVFCLVCSLDCFLDLCCNLVSSPVAFCSWLGCQHGLQTWFIALPCLGLPEGPVISKYLPLYAVFRFSTTVPWLMRVVPALGQPQLGACLPSGSSWPLLLPDTM